MSRAGNPDRDLSGEAGFTLLELVCVLALVGLLAAIAMPAFPRGTSPARLEGYGVAVATLLQADRLAAMRSGRPVATELDGNAGVVRSGATARAVRLPPDVRLGAVLATRCAGRSNRSRIEFFPSGMSCGGVVQLVGQARSVQVRVNWLTGGVDLGPAAAL